MNLKTKFASALAALALAGTLPMTSSAQQKPAQATTNTSKQPASTKSGVVEQVARGSVVTMTDSSMVVRVKKGKDMTFALNSDTEKVGEIGSGKRITVHYRDDKGQHVATSVRQVAAHKTAAAAKSKSK